MQKVDTAELRRLHEAATNGQNWQEEVAFGEACKANLPALLDELEAARLEMRRQASVIAECKEEVRRLTQANGDLRTGCDRAVREAQRQDGVAKGLRRELEAAREALSQIYWKSLKLGDDRGDSTINHIAADALKGDTSPLHARDRRMKLIGAAEELELVAKLDWFAFTNVTPSATADMILRRAAQLRQEAGECQK